jgi:hypothetical protein
MQRLILAILLLFSLHAFAQGPTLSDQAQISVITCGPYQGELYSAFGHSAIRVYDPLLGMDLALNYGVFDFDQPNFYLNFTRGHLLYKLGTYPYDLFRDHYISHNRYVHEQVLDLNQNQKQKVFDYLYWNAQPENVNYLYDYFYNNCATKVRDVFVKVFKDSVSFDGSYVTTNYSIRDLTEIYLKQQPWGDLGIDVCLGLPMDKKITPYEYMFLPDYVESGFNHATLNGQPIVKETILTYEATPEEKEFSLFHPWIVLGLFFVLTGALTYFDWKRKKLSRWFDVFIFFSVGLIGLLLFMLWVATDHHAAANNLNLLWAFPLHAIVSWMIFSKKRHAFVKKYFTATGIVLAATLLLWVVLPQQLNIFLIPVVAALMLRAFAIRTLHAPR